MGLNGEKLEGILGTLEFKKVFNFSFGKKEYSKIKISKLDISNYKNPKKVKIGSFFCKTYPSGCDGYAGRTYENTLKLTICLNELFGVPKFKIVSKVTYEEMCLKEVECERYFIRKNCSWLEDKEGLIKKLIPVEEIFSEF